MDDKKRELLAGAGLGDEMIDRAAERDDLPRYFPPGEHEFVVEHVRQILNSREMVMVCFEGRCRDSSALDLVGERVAYFAVLQYCGELSARQLAEASGAAVISACVDEAVRRHEILGKMRFADFPGRSLREVDALLGHRDTVYDVSARVHVSASDKPLRRDPSRSIVLCKFSRAWHSL